MGSVWPVMKIAIEDMKKTKRLDVGWLHLFVVVVIIIILGGEER